MLPQKPLEAIALETILRDSPATIEAKARKRVIVHIFERHNTHSFFG
jgi:hypothetical protein